MARSSAMCVFGALVGIMALAVAVADPSLAVNTDGLLGLWMMDDDGGQEAEDSSGNEAHMAFDAGGGDWVDGKFGGAIEFDAAGFMDAEAPLLPETRGYTMGRWIKPGSEQKAFTNIMSSHQEPPQRGISFEQNNLEHNSYGVAMGAGQWMGCGNTQFFLDTDVWPHGDRPPRRWDDGRRVHRRGGRLGGSDVRDRRPAHRGGAELPSWRLGPWGT